MQTGAPLLGVVYEHPEWFIPLFAELDRRSVPYERIDVSAHAFDPAGRDVPWTLVLNRMSPSAYLRGHGQAIVYAREFLRYLESRDVDVVNGADAFALETSKVSQFLLLHRLGVGVPRTRVVNHPGQAVTAADGLAYPVAVKPNIGGSGAGIQRFDTPAELVAAVAAGGLDLGIDGTALVQEFLPAQDGHIVRVEVVGGRFLYAIKVYPNPGGFNLCPADICQPGEAGAVATVDAGTENGQGIAPESRQGVTLETERGTSSAKGQAAARVTGIAPPGADLCPADLPKVALRVEGYKPPDFVIQNVLRIARTARLDLVGVEYLTSERDERIYYYDVNALSNFVSNAPAVVGFDPYATLVDYLVVRGNLPVAARTSPAHP